MNQNFNFNFCVNPLTKRRVRVGGTKEYIKEYQSEQIGKEMQNKINKITKLYKKNSKR